MDVQNMFLLLMPQRFLHELRILCHRHKQAQRYADQRRKKSKRRITLEDWKLIERYLRKDFSPEQVSHWVLKYFGIQVSHEWIYQYIWEDKKNGGKLYKHLRHKKKYHKRSARGDNRGKIPNKTSIEDRPECQNISTPNEILVLD